MSINPLLPMLGVEAKVSTVRSGRGVLRKRKFVVIVCVPLPGLESNVQERLEVVKRNLEDCRHCRSVVRVEMIGLKSG